MQSCYRRLWRRRRGRRRRRRRRGRRGRRGSGRGASWWVRLRSQLSLSAETFEKRNTMENYGKVFNMLKHVKTLRGIGRIHFHTIHTQNQEICFRDLTKSTRPAQTLRLKLMLREPHVSPDLVSNRYGKWAIVGQNWICHRCQKSPAILLSSSRAEKAPNAESLSETRLQRMSSSPYLPRYKMLQNGKCQMAKYMANAWQGKWQVTRLSRNAWQLRLLEPIHWPFDGTVVSWTFQNFQNVTSKNKSDQLGRAASTRMYTSSTACLSSKWYNMIWLDSSGHTHRHFTSPDSHSFSNFCFVSSSMLFVLQTSSNLTENHYLARSRNVSHVASYCQLLISASAV